MAPRVFLACILGCATSLAALAQTPAAGTVFRDCSDCPEMVVMPLGEFSMGSPGHETGRDADEGPLRVVTFTRPFAVGRYEVTRGQFAAFVADSGYQSQGGNCLYWDSEEGKAKNDDPSKSWRNPGYLQNDGHPVVCVSWADAKAYADWVAKKTGKPYRLLSEAEWEYAARAGSSGPWPWGLDADQSCRHANIADISFTKGLSQGKDKKWNEGFARCEDGSAYTANAGSHQRNAFGLYDMIGNVWEWTEDCWNTSYEGAPTDGRAWLTGNCVFRVDRGGSWLLNPRHARAANRSRFDAALRLNTLGFRLAGTL